MMFFDAFIQFLIDTKEVTTVCVPDPTRSSTNKLARPDLGQAHCTGLHCVLKGVH